MKEPFSTLSLICVGVVVASGLTACTASNWKGAGTQAQAIRQVAQTQNPTTAPAASWVPIARPIVQTIGQAGGPAGQDILALIAATAGAAGTLFTYLSKQKSDSVHQAAIAELAGKLPTNSSLSTKTTAVVRRVTGS